MFFSNSVEDKVYDTILRELIILNSDDNFFLASMISKELARKGLLAKDENDSPVKTTTRKRKTK